MSGNPAGTGKAAADVIEAAREHTAAAIGRLVKLMEQDEDRDVALSATAELLNRGWGRPAVAILAQINGQIAVGGIDAPPRESLEAWLARRRRELAALDGPRQDPAPPAEPAA